jgi:maleylpyruvate isomerase
MTLRLHAFWRSGASYRTRIALNLKGLSYEVAPVNIVSGEQSHEAFLAVNPFGLVPALETPDGVIVESPAIIEWLEERYPEPALLPPDPAGRARVRAMANIINCDMQPLGNLRVLRALTAQFGAGDAEIRAWVHRWMTPGFTALEALSGDAGGVYCHGDAPGLADCSLIPQMAFARRYGFDLAPFARLCAVEARLLALPAVAAADPALQPDAPRG